MHAAGFVGVAGPIMDRQLRMEADRAPDGDGLGRSSLTNPAAIGLRGAAPFPVRSGSVLSASCSGSSETGTWSPASFPPPISTGPNESAPQRPTPGSRNRRHRPQA